MKKIFSKEKYIENMGEKNYQEAFVNDKNWIDICNGRTVEECIAEGWAITDDWCVEVEDEI